MEDSRNGKSRRNVLKTASLTSLGLALPVGTASASGKRNEAVEVVTASSTRSIGPDSSGLSKEESNAYAERMSEKYGTDATLMSSSDSSGEGADQQPDSTENLTYQTAYTAHLEAKDNDGTVMVESDNMIRLYESDIEDEEGRKHYFYWHWTAGQSRDYRTFTGNLWNMWNRAREYNGNDMLQYDPVDDLEENGEEFTISLMGQYKGAGAGLEGDFTLFEDTVRPHPKYTEVGNNGEFAVQWIGDYEGTQGFVGSCETRRPEGNGRNLDWDVYLKGGKYAKSH